MNRTLSSIAIALTLAATACAAQTGTGQQDDGQATQTEQAMVSNGFICNGNGCVCDPESDNPIDSCDGMMTFCDRIGKGMLCEPGGWCFCRVDPPSKAASPEPTAPPTRSSTPRPTAAASRL